MAGGRLPQRAWGRGLGWGWAANGSYLQAPLRPGPRDVSISQPEVPLDVPTAPVIEELLAASLEGNRAAFKPPPLNATIFGNTWRLGERIHVRN